MGGSGNISGAVVREMETVGGDSFPISSCDPNRPDRFARYGTARTRDARGCHRAVATQDAHRPCRHLLDYRLTDGPMCLQILFRYTEDVVFYFVAIRYDASFEIGGAACLEGDFVGDVSARTAFGRAQRQLFRLEQGH